MLEAALNFVRSKKREFIFHSLYALILITVSLLFVLFFSSILSKENRRNYYEKESFRLIKEVQNRFFDHFVGVSDKISQNQSIIKLLQGDKKYYADTKASLDAVGEAIDADIVYLINMQGTVEASTAFDGISLKGKNYAFRNYFKKAVKGESDIYPALGVTTLKRGIYFSSPVREGKKIIGVVVIKAGLDIIDKAIQDASAPTMLVSPQGVIFAATKQDWLFKSVMPLKESALKKLEETKQFAGKRILPIGLTSVGRGDIYYLENTEYLLVENMFPIRDWKIYILGDVNTSEPLTSGQRKMMASIFFVLLFLLIFIVALGLNIQERKRTSVALKESEENYRQIFNSVNDAIFIHDAETFEIIDINDQMLKMYGFSRDEVFGKFQQNMLDDKEALVYLKKASKGEPQIFEWEAIRKDGKSFWVEVNLKKAVISGKHRIIAVVRDVSDRRMIEDEIINSERNYREIFNSVSVSILIYDVESEKIIDVNEDTTKDRGFPREEYLKWNIFDVATSTNYIGELQAKDYISRALKGEEVIFEMPVPVIDGTIWGEITLKGAEIDGKKRIIIIVKDIDERKRAEDSLRYRLEFENLLSQISADFINLPADRIDEGVERALMDVSMFADAVRGNIFYPDLNTGKVIISHEWVESPELSLKEIEGTALEEYSVFMNELLKGDGSAVVVGSVNEASEKTGYSEDRINKFGFMPMILVPMMKDQRLSGAIAFFGEKEKTKKWPEELVFLMKLVANIISNALEKRNSESVLKDTMLELSRSNEELEQFAYVASHDLKEPLRMVSSYVKLLKKRYSDKLDKDADEFIDFAVEGSERMSALISDLLAYSRVGTKGEEFVETDMNAIVSEVMSALKFKIEDLHGKIKVDSALPIFNADTSQISQLIQNLIENALKFHGDEAPVINIGANKKGNMWELYVRDNGIGISKEYMDRVFVIFQRLHTREDYPGTGIGLAICKKIVERHGGRIWIESQGEGQGSTFYFTIPV